MRSNLLLLIAVNVGIAGLVFAAESTDLRSPLQISGAFQNALHSRDSHTEIELHVASAQTGDSEQLQQIYCELYDSRMSVIFEAGTVKLPEVGGWFAIKSYLQLFDADGRFEKGKPGASDLTYTPPSWWGLKALPRIIPNPPLQYDQQSVEKDSAHQDEIWKKYIAQHESELSKLEPTGTGVEFSPNACRNGRPRKKRPK